MTGAPRLAERAILPIFISTIFLSALLLFSVQPMFAKMVLPTLGGAPAVWAVSMCFFQVLLLLGYVYAHLIDRHAPRRFALPLHLAVLVLGFVALPVALPATARNVPDNAYLELIAILAVGVGLALCWFVANAPLLQAWFARAGHSQSADAYSLYRASNAGSLAALAADLILGEPLLPLGLQSRLWTAGFVLLAFAIAGCGLLARTPGPLELIQARTRDDVTGVHLDEHWRQRASGPSWPSSLGPAGGLHHLRVHRPRLCAASFGDSAGDLSRHVHRRLPAKAADQPARPRHPAAGELRAHAGADGVGHELQLASASTAGAMAFTVTSLICHRELY